MPPIMSSGTIVAPFQGNVSPIGEQQSIPSPTFGYTNNQSMFGGMSSPFNNGILNNAFSQPPMGMFGQPTILSAPTISPVIISHGTIISSDGTIVSEPMSSFQNPPSLSPIDHPCQGKGGSSCGCGGGCLDKKININKSSELVSSTNTYSVIEDVDINSIKKIFSATAIQELILKTNPGNSTFAYSSFPTGEHIISTAKVLSNNSIVLQVKEMTNDFRLFDLTFNLNESKDGWIPDNNGNILSEIIPFDTPLDTFALVGMTIGTGIQYVKNKLENLNSVSYPKPTLTETYSSAPCISHDLVCSTLDFFNPQSHWPWTGDQKHIQYWAPCVGSFTVDIEECCKKHDISLWCAQNDIEINNANGTVIQCIIDAVFKRGRQLLGEVDFKGISGFIAKIACQIAFTIYEILNRLIFTAIMSAAYLAVFGIWQGILHQRPHPELFNVDGSHSESCLCYGKKSTVPCDNPCRNMCKEMGKDEEGCYNCKWKCVYKDGLLVDGYTKSKRRSDGPGPKLVGKGPRWDMGPVDKNGIAIEPCCVGTDKSCRNDFDGHNRDCPLCENCQWQLIIKQLGPSKIIEYVPEPTESGAPCCNKPPDGLPALHT